MTFQHPFVSAIGLVSLIVVLAKPVDAATTLHRVGAHPPATLVKAGAIHRPKARVLDSVARRQTSASHHPSYVLTREGPSAAHRLARAA